MGETLDTLRTTITAIDADIVRMLNRRAEISVRIGALKGQNNVPVYDPSQENTVFRHVTEINDGPLSAKILRSIYREILSGSRALQSPVSVAYLGPATSFSHLAAQSHFGTNTVFVPQSSIHGVFDETEKGTVNLGIVPVENSLEGSVKVTMDRLMTSPLVILGEIYLPIRHNLMSLSTNTTAISDVYSHPQALAQCHDWLGRHMSHCSLHETDSTAKAAERVAGDPRSAAIGSSLAAAAYGLSIVAEGIEDHASNMTRFLIIGRGSTKPTGNDKTSIFFGVRHDPGALHHALLPFAERSINLTKIVSHPIRERMWEYLFFVDFIGHATEEHIAVCLERLEKDCTMVRILGSYPREEREQ